jgi:hypothetical protein
MKLKKACFELLILIDKNYIFIYMYISMKNKILTLILIFSIFGMRPTFAMDPKTRNQHKFESLQTP